MADPTSDPTSSLDPEQRPEAYMDLQLSLGIGIIVVGGRGVVG
jgi:hypothetical protein